MKMKFNYLMTAALALTVGLSSCSSDENGPVAPVAPEGIPTYAELNLTQAGVSSYAPSITPVGDEKVMKTATVYVFNATNTFESKATLDVAAGGETAGKIIPLTTGKKSFYIVANEPAGAGLATKVTVGMSATAFEKLLINVAAIADLASPSATGTGYFMTNTTRPTQATIVEGGTATTPPVQNKQTIAVGRAFSKANVEFPATATQPADGVLSGVEYKVKQQPKQVNLMPFLNGTVLESAYFLKSDAAIAPVAADYFDNATLLTADGAAANSSYMMENSNKVAKQGNATYALLKGVFTPNKTVDADGANEAAGVAGADFWRIGKKGSDNKITYTSKFYHIAPTQAEMDAETGTVSDASVSAYKYTDGETYYAIFFANNAISDINLKYTIGRNTYFYATVTTVSGCGSNDEDGVIVDPTKPIETSAHIEAAISIADWTLVDQQTGI